MAAAASSESADKDGWAKAVPIGVLAGVPTAFFLQIGFLQSLRQRGVPTRQTAGGWLLPAGLGHALARDVCYWAATQKQVQNPRPTLAEEAVTQVLVVAAPLFFDTLSVRAVEPGFKPPPLSRPLRLFWYGCPPQALLGRMVWIPFYNLAYVSAQQRIGDETPTREGLGLVAGSLAASLFAYPLFMFKTNLLLADDAAAASAAKPRAPPAAAAGAAPPAARALAAARQFGSLLRDAAVKTCGADSLAQLAARARTGSGLRLIALALFGGLGPHTYANLGPDVLCMGFARGAYSLVAPKAAE